MLLNPFCEMRVWRNSTKTRQSGHALRSGPEVKNGKSTGSAKDGVLKRLGYGAIQKRNVQLSYHASWEEKFAQTVKSAVIWGKGDLANRRITFIVAEKA